MLDAQLVHDGRAAAHTKAPNTIFRVFLCVIVPVHFEMGLIVKGQAHCIFGFISVFPSYGWWWWWGLDRGEDLPLRNAVGRAGVLW